MNRYKYMYLLRFLLSIGVAFSLFAASDTWAQTRADVTVYAAVTLAALLRVGLLLLWPAALPAAALASAAAWCAAFVLFAIHYGPWLCRPRLDGRPG